MAVGQFCTGNKGVNIFTDGDFGRGADNILQTDPQIAPGYTYVTSHPVQDGQYTITNGLASWASINGWGWIRPKDDSNDPEGYMMVVNASYDPGLFYQEQINGLCENSLFEFTARIINLIQPGENHIRPNVDFLIDGVAIYNTGNIPESGLWNTYGFAFSTQPGQTSVTLALRNNAPGGIGNDLALDNIRFRACGPTAEILPNQIAFACEDSSEIILDATITGNQYTSPTYQWQTSTSRGAFWQDLPDDTTAVFQHTDKAGGLYFYRYLLANSRQNLDNSKCRIVSNTKQVRITPKLTNIRDTICDGLSYLFGSSSLTVSGEYTDSLVTQFGCDSIVTLKLEVVENDKIETILDIDPPSCTNYDDASVGISEILNGTPDFFVFVDSIELKEDERLENLSSGIYELNVIDRFGCELDTFFTIEDPEVYQIDIGPDIVTNLGETISINPLSNYPMSMYRWNSDEDILCSTNCLEIDLLPIESGIYTLSSKSVFDCIASDSIYILVEKLRDIFIPDVFTPNQDGFNDYFYLQGSYPNIKMIKKFKIYNRWGREVFNEENIDFSIPNKGWSAQDKGVSQEAGVYFYEIEVEYLDEAIISYKGLVHLLR